MYRISLIGFIAILSLSALSCGSSESPSAGGAKGVKEKTVAEMTPAEREQSIQRLLKEIESVAAKADGTFEDGWICNRNPRVLKTGYARVPPSGKAKFALEYRKMIEAAGENLALDTSTYVSYKKRSDFTRDYWEKSEYSRAFNAETVKKKIQWVYESMLDGGELFWRAYESLHPQQVNSAAVLAHYKEQDMVFNYSEDERTPGTFSDQYIRWTTDGKVEAKK